MSIRGRVSKLLVLAGGVALLASPARMAFASDEDGEKPTMPSATVEAVTSDSGVGSQPGDLAKDDGAADGGAASGSVGSRPTPSKAAAKLTVGTDAAPATVAAQAAIDKRLITSSVLGDVPTSWTPSKEGLNISFYGEDRTGLGITQVGANLYNPQGTIEIRFGTVTPPAHPSTITYLASVPAGRTLAPGDYQIRFSVTVCDPPGDLSNNRARCVAQTAIAKFAVKPASEAVDPGGPSDPKGPGAGDADGTVPQPPRSEPDPARGEEKVVPPAAEEKLPIVGEQGHDRRSTKATDVAGDTTTSSSPGSPSAKALPKTGTTPWAALLTAGAFVAVGSLLVIAVRRRLGQVS